MTYSASMLYLEDDAALATVTQRALKKRGFNVHYFPSVQSLLAAPHEASYSHALLDLKLEDGTSLELIDGLMARWPTLKIVVLTGYASIATAVQAIKLGAINYLSKPANIEQILRAFDESVTLASDAHSEDAIPLRRLEWEHIQFALQENHGNISATARQLKMHRRTLQRKLSKKPVAE